MVSDTLSDALIRIKNGYMARKGEVVLPQSKLVAAVCNVLAKNGYIKKYEKNVAVLAYEKKVPAITDLDRISKPGLRIYLNKNNIPWVVGGKGIAIISTPSGLMTDKEARVKKIGGELLCKVW